MDISHLLQVHVYVFSVRLVQDIGECILSAESAEDGSQLAHSLTIRECQRMLQDRLLSRENNALKLEPSSIIVLM